MLKKNCSRIILVVTICLLCHHLHLGGLVWPNALELVQYSDGIECYSGKWVESWKKNYESWSGVIHTHTRAHTQNLYSTILCRWFFLNSFPFYSGNIIIKYIKIHHPYIFNVSTTESSFGFSKYVLGFRFIYIVVVVFVLVDHLRRLDFKLYEGCRFFFIHSAKFLTIFSIPCFVCWRWRLCVFFSFRAVHSVLTLTMCISYGMVFFLPLCVSVQFYPFTLSFLLNSFNPFNYS